jgi:4-amino-4-deoxy-L-arabinose transferase-like glycosyltransferase
MFQDRRTMMFGLILLSMASRFAVLQGNLWRLGDDRDGYLDLARDLADYGWLGFATATAYRPPLYPLMLAPFFWIANQVDLVWGSWLAAMAMLHLAFGAATVLCTLLIGERLGLGRFAWLAACLVAVDPLLVHNARLPMTETPAAFLVAWSVLLMLQSARDDGSWRMLGLAAVLGLGMLCRTTLWAFAIVSLLVAAASAGGPTSRRIRWSLCVLTLAIVVQAPWAMRNWIQLGKPVFTTTHGGYTLLLGNNDVFYDEVINGSWDPWPQNSLEAWQEAMDQEAKAAGATTEIQKDAFLYEKAFDTIATRPGDFLLSVVYRMMSLWRVMPSRAEFGPMIRWACAAFYVPELLLMIVGLCDRRVWQWPMNLLPAALISFMLVHLVFWTDMRMRAPIMPAVTILAALGARRIIEFVRNRVRRPLTSSARESRPA